MSIVLHEVITNIEHELARFYAFAPLADASNHLLTRPQLQASLGSFAAAQPEFKAPGGVWLLPTTNNDELFIGMHFDDFIPATLARLDPRRSLCEQNLDAFCVVVEEISHFHLILNRAQVGLEVSKLELECQGEIDKLLICGLLLEKQYGRSYILPLARKLYDLAEITSSHVELYQQATKYAARFWFERARDERLRLDSLVLREQLRHIYRLSWANKVKSIADWTHKVA